MKYNCNKMREFASAIMQKMAYQSRKVIYLQKVL